MKKVIVVFLAMGALFSCQTPDKIGFVDNVELINEYQERKDIEAEFKVRVEAYTKKRDSIYQAFDIEYKEAGLKAQKMSQKKAQELAAELQQKGQILQQQLQFEEQQIQQASQTEIDTLVKKVKDFVKDYGKTNGYTYILGSNDAGSVLYGADAKDLTKTLLEELNKKYEGEKK